MYWEMANMKYSGWLLIVLFNPSRTAPIWHMDPGRWDRQEGPYVIWTLSQLRSKYVTLILLSKCCCPDNTAPIKGNQIESQLNDNWNSISIIWGTLFHKPRWKIQEREFFPKHTNLTGNILIFFSFRGYSSPSEGILLFPKVYPLFPRVCHSFQGYTTLSESISLFPRVYHSFQVYTPLSEGIPLFPRVCHSFQGYTALSKGIFVISIFFFGKWWY